MDLLISCEKYNAKQIENNSVCKIRSVGSDQDHLLFTHCNFGTWLRVYIDIFTYNLKWSFKKYRYKKFLLVSVHNCKDQTT